MRNGFTLVELSIVLVIIGLLIGGILVGQSLIDSANITKIVRQTEQRIIAMQNFKNKYRAMPGDINHSFTNPGDGDGVMDRTGSSAGEWTRVWLHLSESGDLQDSYTGGNLTNEGSVPELDIAENSHHTILDFGDYGFRSAGRYLVIGRYQPGTWNANGVIAPAIMASIDSKMDDGAVDGGDLVGFPRISYMPNCMTNTVSNDPVTSANYNVADDTGRCTFMLKIRIE